MIAWLMKAIENMFSHAGMRLHGIQGDVWPARLDDTAALPARRQVRHTSKNQAPARAPGLTKENKGGIP